MLVNPRLTDLNIVNEITVPGQLSKFSFTLNSRKYNLIILYGPSDKDDHKFFSKELFNYEMFPASEYNIVTGDFNAVQDQYLDCRNYTTHITPKTTKVINDAKIEHDLLDPFRERNELRICFSWKRFGHDKNSKKD